MDTHKLTQPHFHIPVLCKRVVSGYEVSVDNNGLQSGRAREGRHLLEIQRDEGGGGCRGTPNDAGKRVFSPGRHLELLWDHYSHRKGEGLGSSEPNSSNYAAERQSPASLYTPVYSYPLHKGILCAYVLCERGRDLCICIV